MAKKANTSDVNSSISSINSQISTLNTSLNNLKNSLGECAYQNFFNDWNSYDNNHTVPRIRGDGVMEIGQYIDMHTVGHNTDYDKRIST